RMTLVHQTPRGITNRSWNHHVRPTRSWVCALIHVFVTSALSSSFRVSPSIFRSIVSRIRSRDPPVRKEATQPPIFNRKGHITYSSRTIDETVGQAHLTVSSAEC